MNNKKKALKAAFTYTIPVLTGYLFLGAGYGILMNTKGYGIGWTLLISTFVFAGSMQFVGVTLLTSLFNPLYTLLLTLMVNARHLFYGISMLDRFKGAGHLKPYLILGLTDETFSILSTTETPEGINKHWLQFFVTLLNHSYWVVGSAIGSLIGYIVNFNTKGLDFVLTALFVVIFINQWRESKHHTPAVVGVFATILCLLLFGQSNFMIPAMIVILAILTIFRRQIEKGVK